MWRLIPYKGDALKSIPTDNGSEFAEHEWIAKKLHVPIFFPTRIVHGRKEP